jgi:hypothetical protein
MAPQAIENLKFTPANGAPLEAGGSLEEPAETAEGRRLAVPGARDARPAIRLQTAPQAIENLQFTPENGASPEAAGSQGKAAETAAETAADPAAMAEPSSAPAADPEPSPARPALEALPAGRLQMAPQAIENPQFTPGNEVPPEATGSPEGPAAQLSLADPADPVATSQPAPGVETDPRSMDQAAPAGPLDPDPAETVTLKGMVVDARGGPRLGSESTDAAPLTGATDRL